MASVLLGLLLVVLLAACLLAWWTRHAPLAPAVLRELIRRELPTGSTSERVIAFLDVHRISHTGPKVSAAESEFAPGAAAYVWASVRDVRKGNPLADGVFLRFRFTDDLKLVDFVVEYSYTF